MGPSQCVIDGMAASDSRKVCHEGEGEAVDKTIKHHPKPWRGEPTVEGHRLDRGMLPFGIVSTGKLRTPSRMIEQR